MLAQAARQSLHFNAKYQAKYDTGTDLQQASCIVHTASGCTAAVPRASTIWARALRMSTMRRSSV